MIEKKKCLKPPTSFSWASKCLVLEMGLVTSDYVTIIIVDSLTGRQMSLQSDNQHSVLELCLQNPAARQTRRINTTKY